MKEIINLVIDVMVAVGSTSLLETSVGLRKL